MTVRLLTYDGRQYQMPTLLTWMVRRTGTVPADELEAEAVYDGELQEVLPDVNRFAAYQDDTLILRGVVDEYEVEASKEGLLLRLAGRGMAALLLDNEAEAAVYQQATMAEILRTHVTPWGVSCARWRDVQCRDYRVTSGSSQWKALSDFTSRAGGFTPWFTAEGELVAEPLAGSGGRCCTCLAAVPMTRCATPGATRSSSPRPAHGRWSSGFPAPFGVSRGT